MKLYVVKCFMHGCEECGDEYHIVGVFSSKERADRAKIKHSKYEHLHSAYTEIIEVNLDEYIYSWEEKNREK